MIDFGEVAERERNFLRLLFTDPRMRTLYPDWEGLARAVVAYIRMEAARKPDDPRLAELVGDLSIRDPQFRLWWAGTHVAVKRRGTRTYNHPVVGELTLDWDDSPPTPSLISKSSSSRQNQGRLPNGRSEISRRGRPRRSTPPVEGSRPTTSRPLAAIGRRCPRARLRAGKRSPGKASRAPAWSIYGAKRAQPVATGCK
jgi:hypothetical protein